MYKLTNRISLFRYAMNRYVILNSIYQSILEIPGVSKWFVLVFYFWNYSKYAAKLISTLPEVRAELFTPVYFHQTTLINIIYINHIYVDITSSEVQDFIEWRLKVASRVQRLSHLHHRSEKSLSSFRLKLTVANKLLFAFNPKIYIF